MRNHGKLLVLLTVESCCLLLVYSTHLYGRNHMIKNFKIVFFVFMALFVNLNVQAGETNIYKQTVSLSMEKVYKAVYESLEEARFYVVFEPYISKNIERFAGKWGDSYNQNKLESIRSMVFCNGWYANKVSNVDPDMLALCPLRLSLYEKAGETTVVFARPTVIGEFSQAKPVLQEIENKVIEAIKLGLKSVK
ncbi:MAG: hypothetical protein DIZ80_08930 [endosymbiont of Galathealinum brachiosum]|uniref:DUF302 domain-containing protein n=1 Tax=endosymbiont of Galathealinum brachiosum TaxID=2200906 RepID=A0A370DBX6_9GAMM|nr:MAG: hypothetical protein DIZ80_08930 [endosymbiont of Galathealinum brachiosum]